MSTTFDARRTVHDLLRRFFALDADASPADSAAIADLTPRADPDGDHDEEDTHDAFYDALQETVPGATLWLSDREDKVATVGGAIAWAEAAYREQLGKTAETLISPLQQKLMDYSWGLGMALIVASLLLRGKGEAMNMPLFALGIFIAAQLKWGVKEVWSLIARRAPSLIERHGAARLFWVVLVGAYLLSFVEIGLVLAIFGIGAN